MPLSSLLRQTGGLLLRPQLTAYTRAKEALPAFGRLNLFPGVDIYTAAKRAIATPAKAEESYPRSGATREWEVSSPPGTVGGAQTTAPTYTAPAPTPAPTYPSFEEQIAKSKASAEEQIPASYEPIFAELDRQIGLLPEQKVEFERGIEALVGPQRGVVETERAGGVRRLEAAGEEEKGRAASSLRDLEQDIRNQLQARAIYFGSVGAADSSAPVMASEAITREGLKARSGVLNVRNQSLNQIALKIQDVNDLASTQLQKIESWKAGKLYDIGQWAVKRLDELKGAKGEVVTQAKTDLTNRLQQLDDTVTDYRQSIDLWKMQRQADLEDWARELQARAQYTTTTPTQYKIIQDDFGRVFAINPYNPTETIDLTGYISSSGTQEEEEKKGILGGLRDLILGTQPTGQ